jgi:hypothetical protein
MMITTSHWRVGAAITGASATSSWFVCGHRSIPLADPSAPLEAQPVVAPSPEHSGQVERVSFLDDKTARAIVATTTNSKH